MTAREAESTEPEDQPYAAPEPLPPVSPAYSTPPPEGVPDADHS